MSSKKEELNTEKNTGNIEFTDHGDGLGVDVHAYINGVRLDRPEGEALLKEMMDKGRPSPAVAACIQTVHLMTAHLHGVQEEGINDEG